MIHRRLRWTLLPVAIIAFAMTSLASSITLGVGSGSSLGCGVIQTTNPNFSGGPPVTLNQVCSINTPTFTRSASADVASTLTSVSIALNDSASTNGISIVNGPSFGAGATISDSIVVTGGSGTGSLLFGWAIDGTLQSADFYNSSIIIETPLSNAFTLATFTVCGTQFIIDPCVTSSDGSEQTTVSLSVPFTFGTPLDTLWYFRSGIGTSAMGDGSNGSGQVDYTAQLLPLIVLQNGTPFSGASVVSESGMRYSVESPGPAVVPEPGTLGLVMTGLVTVGLFRLRRR